MVIYGEKRISGGYLFEVEHVGLTDGLVAMHEGNENSKNEFIFSV